MGFLKASLSGAVLIGLIMLIRALFIHKIPKKMMVCFWGLAICRLLIPFSLPAPAIYQTVTGLIGIKVQNILAWLGSLENMAVPLSPYVSVSVTAAGQNGGGADILGATLQTAGISVWIIVSAGFFLFFTGNHSKWCRKYRQALPIRNLFIDEWIAAHDSRKRIRIRQSDRIMSPLAYGLWKPVILLPKWMELGESGQLSYVLTHEMIHIKSGDLWKKWLMVVTLCIHWFNPLVWVMFLLFNRDLELSCDEAVVAIHGPEAKAEYAYTLIGMEAERMTFSPLFAGFAKNVFEQRIKTIMSYRKYSVVSVVLSVILFVVIVTLFGFEGRNPRPVWDGDEQPGFTIITQSEDVTTYEIYAHMDGKQLNFSCTSDDKAVDVAREARLLQEQCDIYSQLGIYVDEGTGWLCFKGYTIGSLTDRQEGRGIGIAQGGLPGAVDLNVVYQEDTLVGFEISDGAYSDY